MPIDMIFVYIMFPSFCFALQMRLCCISLKQKQKSNLELTLIDDLIDVNCLKNAP